MMIFLSYQGTHSDDDSGPLNETDWVLGCPRLASPEGPRAAFHSGGPCAPVAPGVHRPPSPNTASSVLTRIGPKSTLSLKNTLPSSMYWAAWSELQGRLTSMDLRRHHAVCAAM